MIRITVKIGDVEHEVGVMVCDPSDGDGRQLVAMMVRDWADGYAPDEDYGWGD